ncbi:MAG: endonuclease NucS [Bifidobacteriaceae bacterium]|jgi:RecB family endonuclease NucS|nr:endonuclease NucS [Bifidobacteriaceae bacterium]
MRLVVAECAVDYSGRLSAHLDLAKRLLVLNADGSVLIHSDGGSYKPLNWMNPPCKVQVSQPGEEDAARGVQEVWQVTQAKTADRLRIEIHRIVHDWNEELGQEPGLVKDGVEAHLQELLAQQVELIGPDLRLIRREYATAIGPVDLLLRAADGGTVAVEVKRRAEIDGVEQLTRYVELLNRDPLLSPVRGVLAAQAIRPQARVLAEDRGLDCVVLDYDSMRGMEDPTARLF